MQKEIPVSILLQAATLFLMSQVFSFVFSFKKFPCSRLRIVHNDESNMVRQDALTVGWAEYHSATVHQEDIHQNGKPVNKQTHTHKLIQIYVTARDANTAIFGKPRRNLCTI